MSGGILGNMNEPEGTGILGNLHKMFTDNGAMLMGMGGGLMSGDWSNASQGAMQGMQMDERARMLKQAEAEKARQRLAAQQAAQKLGIDPILAEASPELIGTVAANRYAPKKADIPNSYQEYLLGLKDPEFAAYRKSTAGGVNVNVGGEGSELDKKLSGKEGEAWSAYKDGAAVSGGLQQDFQVLDELMKTAPQGPVEGRLAQAFPGISTSGAAFQSVISRVAPSLRTPGSGATSDVEYEGMLKSLPSLTNKPEANRLIAETMKAKAAINIKRGEIITAYQNKRIDQATARQELDKLNRVSILSPELKSALGQASGAQGAASYDRSALEAEARRRGLRY